MAAASGWTRAAREQGLSREITPADIGRICGLPFDACVGTLFPDVRGQALESLRTALPLREQEAVREAGGVLYPGVAEGLERLSGRAPLFVLSNCQRWYLDLFLEQSGSAPLFRDTLCHGDTGVAKAENLARLGARHALESAVYVGDTPGDRDAAQTAGFPFLHATWGFGEAAGALAFADFGALCDYLVGELAG